jgi:methionyl-tRNA formyltransferase
LEGLDEIATIDFLISVQYHEILKAHHIDRARDIAINLHMAPLPEYRGCNQFSFAIIDGKEEFGTTLHKMETGIDNGAIIAEKRFPIRKGIRVNELYDETVEASKELFEEAIGIVFEGDYQLIPQESLEEERGCSLHYRKEMAQIKKIDLNWPEEKIWRYIRATNMPGFPPPYAEVNGQCIYLSLDEQA